MRGILYSITSTERYYDQLAKILINSNVRSDGTINNDKLNQAIAQFKAEKEAGHARNIVDMTHVDEYMSPGRKKRCIDGQRFVIS